MIYRAYRLGRDGVLNYLATSESLGAGDAELGHIVDGHGLMPGDVVEVGGGFIMIDEVGGAPHARGPSSVRYRHLPMYEDRDIRFSDGCWSPQMASRLRKESALCEGMGDD